MDQCFSSLEGPLGTSSLGIVVGLWVQRAQLTCLGET